MYNGATENTVVVTNNFTDEAVIIPCDSYEQATEKLNELYNERFDESTDLYYDETFITKGNYYAQIVDGLNVIEYRIGKFCK